MERNQEYIGVDDLDLIEMMAEIIIDCRSLPAFMQMSLDLLCAGMKRPSGGLIVLPNLKQTDVLKVWHLPAEEWQVKGDSLSQPLEMLLDQLKDTGQIQSGSGAWAIPVINRRKLLAMLVLSGEAFSVEEAELLEILTRMMGERIQKFQSSYKTMEREQLKPLFSSVSLKNNGAENVEDAVRRICNNMLQSFQAEGLILVRPPEDGKKTFTRQVVNGNAWWSKREEVDFSGGLLYEAYRKNELMQWSKVREKHSVAGSIDLLEGTAGSTLIGIPIQEGHKAIGIVGLVDSQLFPLDAVDQSLAVLLCKMLGQMYSAENLSARLLALNDELRLRKSEAANTRTALKVLFESTPFLFYIINHEFKIVAINSFRARLAGGSPAELMGKVCYEALYQNSKACEECLVSTTLRTGEGSTWKKRNWNKDDTASDWEVTCYPIKNSKGKTIQAVVSEQDVTEKRRLEAEALQNEKLVAAGQLAASVAHEINNPLAAIIANAQLLLKDISPEDKDLVESVKLIELAGLRASQVVKNLLRLARNEEYEFTPVDINECIQDALSLLSHEFVARPIAIRFERGQNLPPIIASREHLESIWINLLMNSIDAIGDETGTIEINTFYDEGNFYVLFRDSGEGISEEHLGRIFEPFFTTKGHGGGTGLGLSVVKRIVKAHSGSIQVDSEIGKGTTFTIILPEVQPQFVVDAKSESK